MEDGTGNGTRVFSPIMRTKLHLPQLASEWVDRERLITTMKRAHEVPLTLVSAPAGYGKSVLAAQWAGLLESPVAWLSLDASDSELRAFLLYFLAAVDTVSPGACAATGDLLTAGSLAPASILATYLLNDLDGMEEPGAIVLDDYHHIDPLSPVHDLMRRMLEHPPQRFRFVVLTRQDPPFDLPSLRASNGVNEIRLQDLRFRGHETSEFLSLTTDRPVSDEALTHLEREVEGWAVGLRLVSLALRNVSDADAFLKGLPGRVTEIQEYLLQEVLAAQADEVRDCMLASSILDRFCVELLDVVCDPPTTDASTGLAAADFLKELRKSNLFTLSLDARREWFRYHHLFQELLLSELGRHRGPDHVAALHLRASRWFEGAGMIDEAIKHALAAEDTGRAAGLVIRHRHKALDESQWYVLDRWLSLVSTGTVQPQAELLMARAWIALNYSFQVEAVPPLLAEVESLLGDEPGHEQVRGELAACRGYVHWLLGNGGESLQHLDVALERIPLSHVDFRGNADLVFAQANQMVGRKEEGLRFLDDLLAHSESRGPLQNARLLIARVFIYLVAGDLLGAELGIRRLWEVVKRGAPAYARIWASYMQGVIHLQGCEWEAAVEHLGRSAASRFHHHTGAAVDSMAGLMVAHQALGQEDGARATLETLRGYVASLGDPVLETLVVSAEARLAILQGRPAAARRWVEAMGRPPGGALLWWLEVPSITRCRTMIAVGSPGSLAQAEAELRECVSVSEAQHNTIQLVRVLALMAMACQEQDRKDEALGVLDRAVTLASGGNLLFPFVELGPPMVALLHKLSTASDFTRQVEGAVTSFGVTGERSEAGQAGFGVPSAPRREPQAAGRTPESLSNRELDVLELLALRLRNKEIAARLYISPQTVGSHLKRIYQKLAVRGRRQAVERALERGILGREPAGRPDDQRRPD